MLIEINWNNSNQDKSNQIVVKCNINSWDVDSGLCFSSDDFLQCPTSNIWT